MIAESTNFEMQDVQGAEKEDMTLAEQALDSVVKRTTADVARGLGKFQDIMATQEAAKGVSFPPPNLFKKRSRLNSEVFIVCVFLLTIKASEQPDDCWNEVREEADVESWNIDRYIDAESLEEGQDSEKGWKGSMVGSAVDKVKGRVKGISDVVKKAVEHRVRNIYN